MAADIKVRRRGGSWRSVRGTVIPVSGARRYRIIITAGFDPLRRCCTSDIEVLVNGLAARDVSWVTAPEYGSERGYVACNVTVELTSEPRVG